MTNSTLGYGLVLLGIAFAAFAAVVGILTGLTRRESALPWVQRAMYGFGASMVLSNLVMVKALLEHDFSVKYVAQVGSRSTPTIFTVVSLWSALEGSILFWGAIMGLYVLAFTFIYRKQHGRYMQLTLGSIAAVAVFFAFLIAGPANPWTAIPNPLSDGPGPNPLLQNHPLMIIHPPMLYGGYVGMTIPFGIALGALLRGELGDAWLVPLRKWTLVPWLFLTIGIVLGGWWAYAVLGWGGYWAWDPVENASLMPWLTATAFMHSTMVLERKKTLKLWTVALALTSFVLTIVGTFMTRSGVFNSVHSFTQSEIGPTFLVFIAVLFLLSLGLLTVRGHLLHAEQPLGGILSRDVAILLNNLVFSAMTFVVLLGTTFPLVTEALQNKRISVGEPYYNKVALPMWLAVLFLMGVGPVLPWGKADGKVVGQQLAAPAVGAVVLGVIAVVFGYSHPLAVATFALSGFVIVVTVRELLLPAQQRMSSQKEGFGTAFLRSASRARRRTGGYIVHLAVVVVALAVAASASGKIERTGTLKAGETLQVGSYQVRFDGLGRGQEAHKSWTAANLTIIEPNGGQIVRHGVDAPRMNYYSGRTDPVGSPAVEAMAWRDVYVSLRAFNDQGTTATFNAYVFPLVGWIWYALPIFFLGTVIAVWPQRKRREAEAPAADQAVAPGAP